VNEVTTVLDFVEPSSLAFAYVDADPILKPEDKKGVPTVC